MEALKNSEKEAFKYLEYIRHELKIYYEHLYITLRDTREELISKKKKANEYLEVIKQCLLKSQEPKHYLQWDDLEFNHTPKIIDVKLNDVKYTLVTGYNVAGDNLAILRNDKQQYYFLKFDKQFFNDLHLVIA